MSPNTILTIKTHKVGEQNIMDIMAAIISRSSLVPVSIHYRYWSQAAARNGSAQWLFTKWLPSLSTALDTVCFRL